jgi:hypothetical protein
MNPGDESRLRKHLERAIYREHLFETYDNLPSFFSHKERVEQVTEKAVRQLFMNRSQELEGADETTVLLDARNRLNRFAHLEAIKDWVKRRKVVVGCVVTAGVEAAIAALKDKPK